MYPHPLGLPKGSVRATLTLLLSINLIILAIDKKTEFAEALSTIVAVALSFYFGGRMRAHSPTPVVEVDRGQRAWGLPAGSIRTILILLFGGAALFIYNETKTLPDYFNEVINLILGYLLGQSFTKSREKIFGKKEDKVGIVDHIKALAVIVITAITFYLTIFDNKNSIIDDWILLSSIVLGFYFGARK